MIGMVTPFEAFDHILSPNFDKIKYKFATYFKITAHLDFHRRIIWSL